MVAEETRIARLIVKDGIEAGKDHDTILTEIVDSMDRCKGSASLRRLQVIYKEAKREVARIEEAARS